MSHSNNESLELTRPEARVVISALSEHRTRGGTPDEQALNVREHLKEEFGFEEDESTDVLFEQYGEGFFSDTSSEMVTFSEREAEMIATALSRVENDAPDGNRETIRDVRSRFENEFDVNVGAN
ncbi:hypothetical protein [Haladaptatus cibarius]|uniref:hypothetical protein n=1 Tax=Haladaptatus cibarius TaxID=453847 RepID=UPI0006792482|nr:hypothetical protein [Haladaptatus cibarius]